MAKQEKSKEQASNKKPNDEAQTATSSKKQAPSVTDRLEHQVADLKKQLEDKDNQFLRAEAEIQNMTKRFEKERSQMAKYDGQDLATSILPVLDNLKRALAINVTDENGQQLKKGIQMVHDHLEKALADHNIKEIDALGKQFDPNTQQAVQTVAASGDQKADTVVQVLQAGYVLKDRVLRPAMVVVAQ
ncbi:nucleotide exchange factor GrpE [uncultured Limosilactobacillus sp.]|uniref:nucleotide exchange factor GrpE n=1 Tax=uncultured Limosilactobacillus sp. TaxID=2837629 RepID=UPI0025CBA21F|nr:nucleotide exchange factor GrpE [uncultured Limosilactobacillus sp.]